MGCGFCAIVAGAGRGRRGVPARRAPSRHGGDRRGHRPGRAGARCPASGSRGTRTGCGPPERAAIATAPRWRTIRSSREFRVPSAPDMSTLLGTSLNGRYRLEARIGAGGMSTVYRAFDETLERQVAVKLMNREVASDSDQLERFRREARAVAQLSHPHIVGVIDAGEDDGRPYIVLEYVEGETLKDRIRRLGRLPVRRGRRLRDRDRARARRRPRPPHRPPRRQAPERPHRRGGLGQGHRLRDRPHARGGRADRRRARARHHRLRLARAGAGPARHRPVGPLLARRRALRDAHRRGAVQGREPGRGGDEARPRDAPRRPAQAPRGLGRAGRGGRDRDRQAPGRPLRRRRRDDRRPRGRAGDRDRARRRRPPARSTTRPAHAALARPAPRAVAACATRRRC